MHINDLMLLTGGLCFASIWLSSWVLLHRTPLRRYKMYDYGTKKWHYFSAESWNKAHIKAAKLADYGDYVLDED
jgi:hypothetical protein